MLHKDVPLPEWVDDPYRMQQICREIRDTKECGIDTETTGKDNWMTDSVLFWSLCPSLNKRYCLSRRMLRILKEELGNDPSITWAMTNANFDNCMMANSGVPLLAGQIHCTLVMDALYDENRTGRHGLKETAKDHLSLNMNEFKSVFKKRGKETYQDTLLRIMDTEPDKAIDYASLDAFASLAVHKFLRQKLESTKLRTGITLWDYFVGIEAPYTKVLYHNIRRGVRVESWYLKWIRVPIEKEMRKLEHMFAKKAGKEVNLQSPKQLIDVFINRLGHKPLKWTSGGESGNRQPSVDVNVLKIWAKEGCECSKILLKHRELAKIIGTYVDGMLSRQDKNCRIHTKIQQHIAVTGRTSSKDPNLQNLKRPADDIWVIRGAFIPRPGYTLVAADYEQLEMRILADLSGDENMRNVIRKGWDIHSGTASLMYDTPYEKIIEAQNEKKRLSGLKIDKLEWPEWVPRIVGYRQDSKTIGFGIVYGQGDDALAKKLGISREEAGIRKMKFFEPFPQVQEFIEETHRRCRYELQVDTLLGRLRRLVDADSDWLEPQYDYKTREMLPERPGPLASRALRQDVNSRIQGTAAEIAKLAQILTENDSGLKNLGVEQLLQVHDEILFEIPNENLDEACGRIKNIMSRPLQDIPERLGLNFRELSVPLDVDVGRGESWAQAH